VPIEIQMILEEYKNEKSTKKKEPVLYKATITYIEAGKIAKLRAEDEHLQTLLNIISCWDDISILEIHIIKEKGE